jgi:hypothetical protein
MSYCELRNKKKLYSFKKDKTYILPINNVKEKINNKYFEIYKSEIEYLDIKYKQEINNIKQEFNKYKIEKEKEIFKLKYISYEP